MCASMCVNTVRMCSGVCVSRYREGTLLKASVSVRIFYVLSGERKTAATHSRNTLVLICASASPAVVMSA